MFRNLIRFGLAFALMGLAMIPQGCNEDETYRQQQVYRQQYHPPAQIVHHYNNVSVPANGQPQIIHQTKVIQANQKPQQSLPTAKPSIARFQATVPTVSTQERVIQNRIMSQDSLTRREASQATRELRTSGSLPSLSQTRITNTIRQAPTTSAFSVARPSSASSSSSSSSSWFFRSSSKSSSSYSRPSSSSYSSSQSSYSSTRSYRSSR